LEALAICCISFLITLVSVHYPLIYGFDSFLLFNASNMRDLLCYNDSCLLDPIVKTDPVSILLGVVGWLSSIAGELVSQLAIDGIVLSALTLGKLSAAFKYKHPTADPDPTTATSTNGGSSSMETMSKYEQLKAISKRINSACNSSFRLFLLAHIFMFASFVDQYFNPDLDRVIKCLMHARLLLLVITFYQTNQAAKVVST